MKFNRFNNLLFAPATEFNTGGGGASPSAPESPEAPASEAAPEAVAPTPEPSLLQIAFAAAKSKATLVQEAGDFRARAEKAEADCKSLTQERDELLTKVTNLTAEREEIRTALTTAQAEEKTVESAAVAQVAAFGFQSAELPESAQAGETRAELEAKLAAEKDNNKRWELAEKINSLG